MSITASLSQSNTVTGSVSARSNLVVSASQGGQPAVTRVTVPGPKGDSGTVTAASSLQLSGLADVDTTTFGLTDGAILQFRASTQKFTARNELDTTTGNLVLSGGSF